MVEKGGKILEKACIMFGGRHGDRALRNIAGRSSFPHLHERNYKNLVGDEDEERKISLHGKFEGKV